MARKQSASVSKSAKMKKTEGSAKTAVKANASADLRLKNKRAPGVP